MNNMGGQSQLQRYRCPHCGALLETDEPIEGTQVPCPECGGEFVAEAMAKLALWAVKPPQKKSGKAWLWVLLAILLAVAGGGGWWFLAGRGPEGGNTSHESLFGSGSGKSASKVNPTLVLRPEATYSTAFGGRVKPEAYSFSSTYCIPYDAFRAGNPIYFLQPISVTWSCAKASPGGRHIFRRNDDFIVDSPIREAEWSVLPVTLGGVIAYGQARGERRYFGFNAKSTTAYVAAMRTNALHLGSVFPAPVVMSDNAVDSRFCYLNDYGRPSVLMWGISTNCLFECLEGEHALSGYAKVLRKLRQVMADSSQKVKDQGLRTYTQPIDINPLPELYIGDLDAGTREKASVSYEFFVENFECKIKENTECSRWMYSRSWTPKLLDEELAFFSRFETATSTEKAFEPLYCYLSQRKILIDEENEENRSSGIGKKTQQLTFEPIGKQTTTSRVELSATAESGGKVIFSVNNHLGIIEGNTLSFTGAGTVCVTAQQWGNDTWRFAKEVECVDVVKTPQTVDFSSIGPQEQSAQVKLVATSDSGKDVSFRVISGPGRISNGVLSFYGSGSVEVMATVQEDDIWEKASATQTVEVKGPAGGGPSRSAPSRAPVATAAYPVSQGGRMAPEFAPLAAALEAARDNATGANFKKLEEVWKALPDEQRAATQKPVMWAFCAMLWSKGQTGVVAKRQPLIDYRAFLDAVTDRCHDCGGAGRSRETCRVCGGSGIRRGRCSTCGGSGSCSFCHGSGQTGGRLGGSPLRCPQCGGSGNCRQCSDGYLEWACPDCGGGSRSNKCPTCNGSGRIYSAEKCARVVEENLEQALRICHGEN